MLTNKTLLLTGASSGIGMALLEYFIDKVQYIITSNRKGLMDFFPSATPPDNLEHLSRDLTVESDVESLFQYIADQYGKLDILINCVGASLFSHPIEEYPMDEFDKVIAVNLRSAFLLTKYAIKTMEMNGEVGGNIVHFVSSSAKTIAPGKAPYGIAKAGLARLIQYAAYECGSFNIKINGISPTYVFTPRHEREIEKMIQETGKPREEIVKEITSHQALPKSLYPKDLIEITELLVTTQCITGQIYNCCMGEILSY